MQNFEVIKGKEENLLSLDEASKWATDYLGKPVFPSNISYLVQYAKVRKHYDQQKKVKIKKSELKKYYDNVIVKKEEYWKKKLGSDLNWALSFDNYREKETTKHVHRLHPYKGKFIPQLVEYFLDGHIDNFKKEVFFKSGDIILDPFMGSGTTLVQASELGMHSIGIDVSEFNCLISEVKSKNYDINELNNKLKETLSKTIQFSNEAFDDSHNNELKEKLSEFNKKYFPNPDFKYWARSKKIDEKKYSREKLKLFLEENKKFFIENGIRDKSKLFDEKDINSFLSKWFSRRIKQELSYYHSLINKISDENIKNIMKIVLSRTARSCRATTHSDLATLREPQIGPYYCKKHGKICTPIYNILKHLRINTYDTLERLKKYSELKKNVNSLVIHGDSREVDILKEAEKKYKEFSNLLKNKKIDGVFTSPPYVGQIDYHEQHAYAYELFNIKRKDEMEIGPLFKGQGKEAKESYVEGISKVLKNISKYVKDNGDFFIVANDKYTLYPKIAEKSGLKIVEKFKRPVLNRTEKDRQPYAEIIFHMKKDKG